MLPLQVSNWLKTPQRFRVEIRAPDKDPSTSLTGHDNVDVPAGLSRDYMLSFYAFKEGATSAEVYFTNEKTGEFIFYKLQLKADAAGVLETIDIQAPLRQLSHRPLPLSNPLDVPVTFSATVNNAEVVVPSSLTIEPGGKSELPIEWRPLLPRETTSQLKLDSAELGAFAYDLRLKTLPLGDAKALRFKECLGGAQTLRFRFVNFLRRAETYKLTLAGGAGSDFEVEPSVAAPAAESSAGVEVAVDVTYEPSKMGESADTLTVSSAEGGEFVCQLVGVAAPPRPQGPISLSAGGTAQVTFKNVFTSNGDFFFVAEPSSFTVAKPKETVTSKKSTQIAVTFKPADQSADATGKLTVSGPDGFMQVYYLSGQIPGQS